MPRKRPPNAEATQFKAGDKQVEIARMGGYASVQARREKKTIQKLLNDFLDSDITDYETVAELARKNGLPTEGSVKSFYTMACVLSSLNKGDMSELEKLARLLGEQTAVEDSTAKKQADFLEAVKEAIKK